jgi:hypothetical protein
VKVGERGPYVVLLEDRDGAGNESTGSHFAGEGEKITGWQAAKKWRGDGLWERRWMEKPKNDFPTQLGNPANPAGFPLSNSLGDCGRLTKTGHFICYKKGIFPKS